MRTRDPNRLSLIFVTGTLVACITWALASRYIAPELIRSAYYGSGWPILNRMITGQASHSLLMYLNSWNAFSWRMLLVLLLSGLLVMLVARPEIQNAFWGPEPAISAPRLGADATAQPLSVNLSWRENLTSFVHPRKMALLLGVILALTLFLRLLSLGDKSLSEDEIFSVLLARDHLLDFWNKVAHSETNMVLYYAILRFWIHLGQSEFAIRSLSVIFALGSVMALYSLGTRAFGRQVGSLGALLLAINGFHIEYSQDARSYSLLVFLVTLSSLFFLQSVHEGSQRDWIRYIVTSTLAVYAHIFGLLVLLAHWVSILFVPRKQVPWRRLVSSTAAIALLALPMELFILIGNHGQISWVPKPTVRGIYGLFACLAGNPDDYTYLPGHGTALLLCVYLIPVVIAILALTKSRFRLIDHTEAWHVAFFLTWLCVPILLVLALSLRVSVFWNRFLIICLPPFILLASYGLSRIRKGWAVALLCVIAALTTPGLLTYYKWAHKDWRGATHYVLSNKKPGDAVVVCPGYFESRFAYYLKREQDKPAGTLGPQLAVLGASSDSSFGRLLEALPSQYDRVWFISDEEAKSFAPQKRLIEASLANEFHGIPEEERFPDVLVVVLYHK